MMEYLNMGGYAAYVWSSYGIVAIVLILNILSSLKRYQSILVRIKKMHTESKSNES